MIKRGIHILLVCDADDNIIGLLTSRDIAGDKPHRILAKAGGVREDLRVSDVMTLRPKPEVLSMEDLQRARVGDLIATCMSPLSRNHSFGVRLGQGMSVSEVIAHTSQTAESVKSCTSILDLALKHGVDVPIIEQVHAMIVEERSAEDVVRALLSRPRKAESA